MLRLPHTLRAKIERAMLERPDYRARAAAVGALLNRWAYRLDRSSRGCVRFMNPHVTDAQSDWFVHDLPELHRKIEEVLRRQRTEYGQYFYFYGYPYQALATLGVYGERATEERFEAYGLRDLIGPQDRLLDIGCNCGFMALYTSYRTGCKADAVDINPYMIEIGQLCAEYLRLSDKVHMQACRIQDLPVTKPYTVVFSFATHWTDDENYRVPLREHFERMAGYLEPNGLLVFESHAADVGNAQFYAGIEQIKDLFAVESLRDTDNATRHLYLFRRRG